MDRYVVTILPGGRITIPAAIRRGHELGPGDDVIWFEQAGNLCFRKAHPGETSACGDCPSSSKEVIPTDTDRESAEGQA